MPEDIAAADRAALAAGRKANIIDYFGDRHICDRCGASISSYSDKCSAPLDDPCEGFLAIEDMLTQVKAARRAIVHEAQS